MSLENEVKQRLLDIANAGYAERSSGEACACARADQEAALERLIEANRALLAADAEAGEKLNDYSKHYAANEVIPAKAWKPIRLSPEARRVSGKLLKIAQDASRVVLTTRRLHRHAVAAFEVADAALARAELKHQKSKDALVALLKL